MDHKLELDGHQPQLHLRHVTRMSVIDRGRFATGANNRFRSMSPRRWVCQRKILIWFDRRASCPLVTFQTERKGGFELIAAGAIEIDTSGAGAHVTSRPTAPPASSNANLHNALM